MPLLTHTRSTFDVDAFTTPLWVAPPAPPSYLESAPPTPEPPPPPLKVQLLSILREPSGNRAMFFDPDSKKVLTLDVGDPVGAASEMRSIASIGEREVVINGPRPQTSQTLSLREPSPATTPSKPGRSR